MRKNLAKAGRNKSIGSITFYAAMSPMDGNRNIQRTKGYEMLRQAAYARQMGLAEEMAGRSRTPEASGHSGTQRARAGKAKG